MSLLETVQLLLSICGGISIIGGAVAVIHKWISPAIKLNERVEVLEQPERDSMILEVLSTMLDSQISGNNTEQLKKTREKLTQYLAQNQR